MANYTISSFAFVVSLSTIFTLSAFASIVNEDSGIGIELIHRDSLNSPLLDPSKASRSVINALQRSARRVEHFRQALLSRKMAQSTVSSGYGDYLMKLSIGTPPVEIIATADTGSDLVWTQCKPCDDFCFDQKLPLFDPKASSTYRNETCDSATCQSLSEHITNCDLPRNCHYIYSFADDSFTLGTLARDTLTLGSTTGKPFILPETLFGCGTDNEGNFDGTGIVGLGRGAISLTSRVSNMTAGKFSYCLVPSFSKHSSKMNFGSKGEVSGHGVATTPLLSGDVDTFYSLRLEGISVNGKRINLNTSGIAANKGNIIIDSGTTLTYLDAHIYDQLQSEMRKAIPLEPYEDVLTGLDLCYKAKGHLQAPRVTMHFTGADVMLSTINTFIRMDEDVVCLAFAADSPAIYGNTQQVNFLTGYDVWRKTVSFYKTDCTKH